MDEVQLARDAIAAQPPATKSAGAHPAMRLARNRFTSFASSVFPVEIMSFSDGAFHDSTAQHPERVNRGS